MIEVQIDYRKERICGFTVKGHAGFGYPGEDIYCAGVSAITQTALLGLMCYLSQPPYFQMEEGLMECRLGEELTPEEQGIAQVILGTMEAGLKAMQESYGQYLSVKVRRL
jgi:uncharacterized protein YsxB (DUF464 family)